MSKSLEMQLPHGQSFRLIHRLVGLDKRQATAVYHYSGEEVLKLADHFPHPNPRLMPGVLVIEGMAQTAIQIAPTILTMEGKLFTLLGINKARIRKSVTPGETITYVARITRLDSRMGIAEAVAYVSGQAIAEAEFLFGIVDNPQNSGRNK